MDTRPKLLLLVGEGVHMKIRSFFLLSISVEALVGILTAAWLVVTALHGYRTASEGGSFTSAVAQVSRLEEKLAIERGDYNVALAAAQPADKTLTDKIASRVQDTNQAAALAKVAVANLQGEHAAGLAGQLDGILKSIDDLRKTSDVAIQKPKSDRDQTLAGRYADGIVALLKSMDTELDEMEKSVAEDDPLTDGYLSIGRGAMELRLTAGTRSSMMTMLVASNAGGSRQQLDGMTHMWGQISHQRDKIAQLVEMAGRPASLVAALDKLDQGFMKPMAEMTAKFSPAMHGEEPYPMDLASFRPLNSAMLPTILAMRDAAYDAAIANAATEESKALGRLLTASLLVALTVLVAIGAATLFSRRVLVPLASVTGVVGELAQGRNEVTVPGTERSDELGDMAKAVETLRRNAEAAERMKVETARQQEERQRRAAQIETLCAGFDQESGSLIDGMSQAATQAMGDARGSGEMASEARRRSEEVARAADEASASVQTVAAAAEELAASIHEISSQVSSAAQFSARAVGETEEASRQIANLAEASARIGDIVRLITDIAGQTNLLALNATIEAARAGDAGKGFAVVAGEVKNLANKTARATDEISAQITAIQTMTGEVVTVIENVGRTISQMDDVASAIAAAVEEQGATTSEIARNVQLAANRTAEVSQTVGGVAQVMTRSEGSATSMVGSMETLERQAGNLAGRLGQFLKSMRGS